jgi:hypothetical protein
MQRVLPGGVKLGGGNNARDEQRVACRPGAAVLLRTRPRTIWERLRKKLTRAGGVVWTAHGAVLMAVMRWSSKYVEKVLIPVLIAVLTAILLAWLGLSK